MDETRGKSKAKGYRNPKAEEMRIRALYRRKILRGEVALPVHALRPLFGPDCAYHLYRFVKK